MEDNNQRKPVDRVKVGPVVLSIWRNSGKHGDWFTATAERLYKDRNDAWASSSSFGEKDLAELAKAADLAHAKVKAMNSTASGEAVPEA